MFENNPLFFIYLFFFQHTVFLQQLLCFAENTINIVFSEEHSFSITQLVKPTFFTHAKKHLFQQKSVIFGLGNFRWSHNFHSFSWFWLFWTPQTWPKQIVRTKMRCLSRPSLTQIVFVKDTLAKNPFLSVSACFEATKIKNLLLLGKAFSDWPPSPHLWIFGMFSVSLTAGGETCNNITCNSSICRKPFFLLLFLQLLQNSIWATIDTICVLKGKVPGGNFLQNGV